MVTRYSAVALAFLFSSPGYAAAPCAPSAQPGVFVVTSCGAIGNGVADAPLRFKPLKMPRRHWQAAARWCSRP